MSDPDTDPYTAYYEFEPVRREIVDRRSHPEATVVHELGLAGSRCPDREWGTKVTVRCPRCDTTGKVVRWDGGANVYACPDCDTVVEVPVGSDERLTRDGEGRARATAQR